MTDYRTMESSTDEATGRKKIIVKLFNGDSSKLVEEELRLTEAENRARKDLSYFDYSTVFVGLMAIIIGSFMEVMGKIVTVPMGMYSSLLSFPNAFIYLLLYHTILLLRIAFGYVPASQLYNVWRPPHVTHPKRGVEKTPSGGNIQTPQGRLAGLSYYWDLLPPIKYYIIIGILDALGSTMKLVAKPRISGDLIVFLQETNTFFVTAVTVVILRKKFTYWQVWSILLSFGGIYIVMMQRVQGVFTGELLYIIIMAVFPVTQATSYVLKEKLFLDTPGLDIFVVNSQNTIFQCLFQPLFIFIGFNVNQNFFGDTTFSQYVVDGFLCLFGIPNVRAQSCASSRIVYAPYVLTTAAFNIFFILLVKKTSAVHSYIILKLMTPVAIFLFYFDWGIMPPSPFGYYSLIGLPLILVSIVIFAITTIEQEKYNLSCFSFRMPFLERCLGDTIEAEID